MFGCHKTLTVRLLVSQLRGRAKAMSSEQCTGCVHTVTLQSQPHHPVHISSSPGLSNSEFRRAVDSHLFQKWLNNMQSKTGALVNGAMSLKQVLIQGIDMFGDKVGFLKFKADVLDNSTGKMVPGIVFARGQSVCVLMLLESGSQTFTVLTEQIRIPVGRHILELPAGMIDEDSGDIVGTAIQEVEEETGLHLHQKDLFELTSLIIPSIGNFIFLSPGGCDEEIKIFLYRGKMSQDSIVQLQGKVMGEGEHEAPIKVHVIPYQDLWRSTTDAKTLAAIALFEMAKRENILP